MKWFGEWWDSGICQDCEQTETPVGVQCIHCDEEIEEGDRGIIYANGPVCHLNCFLRSIFGSVAHIRKECGCFVPGSTETDPVGMTRRQAADAAVAEYFRVNKKEG